MNLLITLAGPVAAIVGVIVGGLISYRHQLTVQRMGISASDLTRRQEVCADYLAAARSFRRFVMYSQGEFTETPINEESKGGVLAAGREQYDQRLDETISRLLILVSSRRVVEAAQKLVVNLNRLARLRAQRGIGLILNVEILNARIAERAFAELVQFELGYGSSRAV